MSRRTLSVAALFAAGYVAAYLSLSRRGYEEADRVNFCGFYYFTPRDTDVWRVKHHGCAVLFCPLNVIDRQFGTGHPPAKEPLWGLSR